jgi:hypothetical protein
MLSSIHFPLGMQLSTCSLSDEHAGSPDASHTLSATACGTSEVPCLHATAVSAFSL